MSIFQNLISSIKGGTLGSRYFRTKDLDNLPQDINKAVESVMSKSGEVSALVYAENLFNLIEALNDKQFINFLNTLFEEYDIDTDSLSKASIEYSKNKTQENLEKISQSSEPEWVELFRRLNTVSDGTLRLVKLRERIRLLEKDNHKLAFFDAALLNLFKHWFNPSFLVLKRIDWSTPASILEKIIAYEAVHEINSWSDLRSRLEPEDRRCFAFFHPLIPNEPLIFVEVALTDNMPKKIDQVIKIDRSVIPENDISTAVFYSISSCQDGLSGISFGNFLIKEVVHKLKRKNDGLEKFVTLSPVPGFSKWLKEKSINGNLDDEDLLKNAIIYFLHSNREDGFPNDPVARFHLGNGARLERVNLNADMSLKGIHQSKGIMVNYQYDLDLLENNHELFFRTKEVQCSERIKNLSKKLEIQ
ncbi:MAG: decarboxylase [Gammaproteobacteria bacterium]|nr:decarboxylase [Gammaproteobacteria bacterium]HAH67559.1 decarboxylase [Gammaproteobacteria bacterium]